MRKILSGLALAFISLFSYAQKDLTKLVNPFIGTGGHGHTYPGASMPFGMMQLSPDTRMADWDGSSGYHYSDSVIYGFSHTHLSGTGIPDYCDILFMPYTGKTEWKRENYRSPFSHKNEKASPGYYEVFLDKHRIRARLTTSLRSGMHEYAYPAGSNGRSMLIDLTHRDEVLESWIEKINDREVRGMRRSRSWAQNQYIFFHAIFEQPIKDFVVLNDEGKEVRTNYVSGKQVKAALAFSQAAPNIQRVRVGISAVSAENALLNLKQEIGSRSFEAIRTAAKNEWNRELSRIIIEGGTQNQQVNFYTALYHCFLAPNVFQDVNGEYRGTDLKVHKAAGFTNYTVFSLWDTYRAYHPLMNLIQKKRSGDWIKTFLAQYKNGGMLPVWELAGNETFCMIGYHSVPVILDAYIKGVFKGDEEKLLEAMVSYADSDRFGLEHYRQYGYISNEKEHESVSKTLEYAYDDWCIAQFARITGNEEVYRRFMERAGYWQNVFDPSTGHMRGKVQAKWYTPFDPAEINNFFTEANSWQYSFAVPHDIDRLISLHGGRATFIQKLDALFSVSSQTTGRQQADVTGLIGQYAHGNEPSHHMAYLYNYVGQPWKTQQLVNRINNEFYTNAPDGLIGNEDCGQMSAWYVFSALGFYPVCPGDGKYIVGTPLFDRATIRLENGKTILIETKRKEPGSIYVESLQVNGKAAGSYLDHKQLDEGGRILFNLVSAPTTWGTTAGSMPTSAREQKSDVAVPFVVNDDFKFRQAISVELASVDREAKIFYKIIQPGLKADFQPYQQPFSLSASATIEIYAERNGRQSPIVEQYFHKIPNDYTIEVKSEVHPMYTAGGAEALLDGLTGTINWRTGEWHSYFDRDFEAIVDLKQEKELNYLGIHVLQDVSPWIIYPKEVIFYTSTDGINFIEAGRALNNEVISMENKGIIELGLRLNGRARYIRIRAVNGGKLPGWHESAGQGSHLFIDEIIIR